MSVTVAATISNQISVSATIGATLTINTGSDVNIISCTLPASGSTITDVDGNTVGTWTATDEISFTALASISLKNIIVEVSGNILRYINSSDTVNDIDDAASTSGTIKLLSGRNLFQRGKEVRIIYIA